MQIRGRKVLLDFSVRSQEKRSKQLKYIKQKKRSLKTTAKLITRVALLQHFYRLVWKRLLTQNTCISISAKEYFQHVSRINFFIQLRNIGSHNKICYFDCSWSIQWDLDKLWLRAKGQAKPVRKKKLLFIEVPIYFPAFLFL